jgi:hypothetical protein
MGDFSENQTYSDARLAFARSKRELAFVREKAPSRELQRTGCPENQLYETRFSEEMIRCGTKDRYICCQRALNRHIHIVLFGTKLARSQPNNPLEVKGELALV